jgi:small-conductance mechanosensitive channel
LKNSHYDYLIPRETGTVHQSGRNSDDSTSYPSVGGKVVSAQKNKEQGQKSLARLQQEQQEPDRLQREEQEQQLESKKRTKSEQRGSTRSRELTRLISSYNDGTVTPSSGSVSTRLQTKRRG